MRLALGIILLTLLVYSCINVKEGAKRSHQIPKISTGGVHQIPQNGKQRRKGDSEARRQKHMLDEMKRGDKMKLNFSVRPSLNFKEPEFRLFPSNTTYRNNSPQENIQLDSVYQNSMAISNSNQVKFIRKIQMSRRNVMSTKDVNNTSSLLSCKGRCLNERDAGRTKKLLCLCDPHCDLFKNCCSDYVKYCLRMRPTINITAALPVLRSKATLTILHVKPSIDICTSPLLSCKDRCLNKRDAGGTQKLRCSCDPYCDYFKDCCADYVKYCLGERSMKLPDEQWTCRSNIWMIASCPKSWTNQGINKSCITIRSLNLDNYKDVLPVVTPDNKTYANQFCAQCHGQNLHTLVQLYEIQFQCLVAPPSQATTQEKMKFLFEFCKKPVTKLKKEFPKRYCHHSKAKCSSLSTTKEVQAKCLNGHYGLVSSKTTKQMFKNVYCGSCNGVMLMECGPTEMHALYIKSFTTKARIGTAIPFSVIMDFSDKSSSKASKTSEISACPRGKVYDVYLETCRHGQQVVPVLSNSKKYRVVLWMEIKGKYEPFKYLFNELQFQRYFVAALRLNSKRISSVQIEWLDKFIYLYKVEFNIDLTNISSRTVNNLTLLFGSFKPFLLKIRNYTFIVIKITVKPLTCVQTDTYSPNEYQMIPGKLGSVHIKETGEVLGVRDYFSNNTKIVDGKQIPVGDIVVCRQMLSVNCSGMYIFLRKHEYVIFPNRSVLYNASGHLYEYGAYMWKNGTIMICTNFKATYQQSYSNANKDDNVLMILTYIGFSISVLCLLFVLVTYSLFADLRTIPGINLMNLSSSLLVAQLLWLVGSGLTFTRLACTVIAIVLHYSFLASFSWMSIIAFDTWRAFSGKLCSRSSRNDKRQKRKRILRMMAVGWLPLIIYLIVFVALDKSGIVAIGYGGDKGCWINNSWSNLYFFAIPVAISTLWNVVFFVLIIKEIKKAIDQSQMVASQHQARKDSTVYARIAVLMGFTWVFGFMVPFTSYYLMYPFVILNTLQGLYIAIAFGFTRRVRVMYKNIGTKSVKSSSLGQGLKSTDQTRETKV